jgi:hypothetical protein
MTFLVYQFSSQALLTISSSEQVIFSLNLLLICSCPKVETIQYADIHLLTVSTPA